MPLWVKGDGWWFDRTAYLVKKIRVESEVLVDSVEGLIGFGRSSSLEGPYALPLSIIL